MCAGGSAQQDCTRTPLQKQTALPDRSIVLSGYLEVFHQVDEAFKRKPARSAAGSAPTNSLFSNNDRLYAEASLAVHGALGTWLSGFETPASLSFDALKQTKLENYISDFAEIAIAFLVAAHLDRFSALDDYTKSIVLSRLSAPKRQKFRELLNV